MKILFVALLLFLFDAVFGQKSTTMEWTKSTSNIVGRIDTSDLIRDLKRSIMYHIKRSLNGTECAREKDNWSPITKFSKVMADFDLKPVMRELRRRISYEIQTSIIDSQKRTNYSQSVLSILSSQIDTKIAAQNEKITSISSGIDTRIAAQDGQISAQDDVITAIDATAQKLKDDIAALISENKDLKENQTESKKKQENLYARLQVLEEMVLKCKDPSVGYGMEMNEDTFLAEKSYDYQCKAGFLPLPKDRKQTTLCQGRPLWLDKPNFRCFKYEGCYLDDENRHLEKSTYKNTATMDQDECFIHCKGYKYIGLELTECYCGNEIKPLEYPKKDESECTRICDNDKLFKCGGPWRVSIYRIKD